jgi:hypothetical protein
MAGVPDGKKPMAVEEHVDSEAASEIFDSDVIFYAQPESGKIGVAGAVFLILNKMIGTGSRSPLDLSVSTRDG